MKAAVLGIGNILLSDEGFGVRAVERFADAYEVPSWVEVIDGGTCGMELLDVLSGLDLLVVADAVKAGRRPGELVMLAGNDVPVFLRQRLSPHQLSLSDVLAHLDLLDDAPRETLVLGVQPVSLDTGIGLSAPVAARLPEVVQGIVHALSLRGIPVARRAAALLD